MFTICGYMVGIGSFPQAPGGLALTAVDAGGPVNILMDYHQCPNLGGVKAGAWDCRFEE